MKEVYINGCNVAKCYFYYKGECRCELDCTDLYKNETIIELAIRSPEHNYMECKPSDNCYFKQLQRAKAELEQYKKSKQASYESMQAEWNNAVNELRDVKAENEKLKAKLRLLKNTVPFNIEDYIKDNPELKEIYDKEVLHFLLSIFALPEWQEDLNKTLNEVLNNE